MVTSIHVPAAQIPRFRPRGDVDLSSIDLSSIVEVDFTTLEIAGAMQRVNIIGPDRQAMVRLARADGVRVVRQTLQALPAGRYEVQAFGEPANLARLAEEGFVIEHIEDVPEGPLPGFRAPGAGPVGYLDVNAVDARVDSLATGPYADVVTLIDFASPNMGRQACRAVPNRPRGGKQCRASCLLGGVHAREWGSADILVEFR